MLASRAAVLPPVVRGVAAGVPFAEFGAGEPVFVLAGASHLTGVDDDLAVREMLPPAHGLVGIRRIIVLNRWPGIARGTTMSDFAERTAAAMTELVDGPADVVGCSTGGAIAQQLAATHPARVRRLVLASCAARLGVWGRARQEAISAALVSGDARRATGLLVGALIPTGLAAAGRLLGGRVGERLFAAPGAAEDLAATLRAEDTFDLARLPTIDAPTLLVSGVGDRFYPAELVRATAELIPDSRVHLEPRAGHVLAARRRAVRALVTEFLGGD